MSWVLERLFRLLPKCLTRFPDGECFYVSDGELRTANRLRFSGWYSAEWRDLISRYRRYWRDLPVFVEGRHAKNFW
jgi:hypothetical protein